MLLTKKYAVLVLCLLMYSGASLLAEPCELGLAPAATLLLPYFEVEYDNPSGLTTLFSIHNVFAEPAVVHVTFDSAGQNRQGVVNERVIQ